MNPEGKDELKSILMVALLCGIAYAVSGPVGLGVIALFYLVRSK